ncbi:hypothetical protein pb186bvf_015488 [Paramecium bursaria]
MFPNNIPAHIYNSGLTQQNQFKGLLETLDSKQINSVNSLISQLGYSISPYLKLNLSRFEEQRPYLEQNRIFNDDDEIKINQQEFQINGEQFDLETKIKFTIQSLYQFGKLKKDHQQQLPSIISIKVDDQIKNKEMPAGVDLICLIDKSGSMQGPKLVNLKKSLRALLEFLTEKDRICLISFDSSAERLTQLKRCSDKNKRSIRKIIGKIRAGGGTNIGSSTNLAFKQIKERKYQNNVTSIFLLSDGQDGSAENTVTQQLKEVEQAFTIHSFGFGADHDAPMMTKICNLRNGAFYFVSNISLLDEFFVNALGALVTVVADQITISVLAQPNEPFQDIKIGKTYGTMWKQITQNRSYDISLQQLAEGQRKDYLFDLLLPQFNQILGDNQRQTIVVKAKISMRNIQTQKIIQKDAELQLTFFNENEQLPINEQDIDVSVQYYRVKSADIIQEGNQLCQQNQHAKAQELLKGLLQQIRANPKCAERSQGIIQDLDQAIKASEPRNYEMFGAKQMCQMTSNNYNQMGQNAIFQGGLQMQQQQIGQYDNRGQERFRQQIQSSKK